MNAKKKALTAFINALEINELDPRNAEEFAMYVPTMVNAMVGSDPVLKLAYRIESSIGANVHLFSGMIGTGKSTQLLRLRDILEKSGHIALYVDIRHFTNINSPVGIVDLMMSVAGAFSEEASAKLGEDVAVEDYWTRASNFLKSRVTIDNFDFGVEPSIPGVKASAKIKLELDKNVTFKEKLQAQTEGMVGEFIKDVRDYVSEVCERLLEGREGAKVILIVDSMEKIEGNGSANDPVMASVRKLFRVHFDDLFLPPVNMVYTVSPYLLKIEPSVAGKAGQAGICTLATLPVFEKDGRTPRRDSVGQLIEFVEKRYADWKAIFSVDQLTKIAVTSGGDFREFRLLLGTVLTDKAIDETQDLKITDTQIDVAFKSIARHMLPLREPERERLMAIDHDHQPRLVTDEDADGFVNALVIKKAFMYLNGEEWYGVHPLLWNHLDKSPSLF
jgi:hypothetical protein